MDVLLLIYKFYFSFLCVYSPPSIAIGLHTASSQQIMLQKRWNSIIDNVGFYLKEFRNNRNHKSEQQSLFIRHHVQEES